MQAVLASGRANRDAALALRQQSQAEPKPGL